MSASCFAPWCGIDGKYANPGVCNAPGGHRYKEPESTPSPDERWSSECVSRHDALEVWQRRSAEWTDDRIPNDNLQWRGLILGEETGEVLRCILKADQDIRGGRDKWLALLPAEAADVFFCLTALAHRAGFDLGRAIEDRWRELSQRTREGERTATR